MTTPDPILTAAQKKGELLRVCREERDNWQRQAERAADARSLALGECDALRARLAQAVEAIQATVNTLDLALCDEDLDYDELAERIAPKIADDLREALRLASRR